MENLQLKIGFTDLVYSITVHSFLIFWSGIGLLFVGSVGLVLSGASCNMLTEFGGYMMFAALIMEGVKALFNKLVWKQFF